MKIQHANIGLLLSSCLVLALSLSACREENAPQGAIAFVSDFQEEQAMTRADVPLNDNFVVWGYKTVNSAIQTVFQGYNVKYVSGSAGTSTDNTHGYSYVDPLNNQLIKYWDFGASEYNFWGYIKNTSDVAYDEATCSLTINALSQSLTEPTLADIKTKLFSGLYHRSPVSTDVVQLKFKRPYSKVRVMFYAGEPLSDYKVDDKYVDNIQITGITFGPESPAKIVTAGTLTVTYPTSDAEPESYSTTPTSSVANWGFGDVTLDHEHGTASNHAEIAKPIGGTEYYIVVPQKSEAPFKLSATIDNEPKTAVVPAALMNWKPNFVYTYIFKISGGDKIEFYDVKIDPWRFGGSQEDEWRNW